MLLKVLSDLRLRKLFSEFSLIEDFDQGWWSRRLCKVLFFREILFIYNYLGLKKNLGPPHHENKTKVKT